MNPLRSKTNGKWHYCKHCGNRFTSFYMADICWQLDMKQLEFSKPKDEFGDDLEVKLIKRYCNN